MTGETRAAVIAKLEKRVQEMHPLCVDGCWGRCKDCPDDLIRDLLAALHASGEQENEGT